MYRSTTFDRRPSNLIRMNRGQHHSVGDLVLVEPLAIFCPPLQQGSARRSSFDPYRNGLFSSKTRSSLEPALPLSARSGDEHTIKSAPVLPGLSQTRSARAKPKYGYEEGQADEKDADLQSRVHTVLSMQEGCRDSRRIQGADLPSTFCASKSAASRRRRESRAGFCGCCCALAMSVKSARRSTITGRDLLSNAPSD